MHHQGVSNNPYPTSKSKNRLWLQGPLQAMGLVVAVGRSGSRAPSYTGALDAPRVSIACIALFMAAPHACVATCGHLGMGQGTGGGRAPRHEANHSSYLGWEALCLYATGTTALARGNCEDFCSAPEASRPPTVSPDSPALFKAPAPILPFTLC